MKGAALALAGTPRVAARHSLGAQVHATLRDLILHASLKPGEPVSENDLAERLGVSRTPVREAMQRLVGEGLIHVLPQRGSFIARVRLQSVREALFVREAVECQIVLRLMHAPDLKDIVAELDALIRRQADAVSAGDLAATMAADADFHRRMIDRSGLPGVWGVVQHARDMHQRVRAVAVPELGSGNQAVADHRKILAALRAGDAERAAAAVRTHLQRNAELTRAVAALHPDYFEAE